MLAFAREKIAQGSHIVIMGHRHVPTRVELGGGGVYGNLGDETCDGGAGKNTLTSC